jgi:hypothetical protein
MKLTPLQHHETHEMRVHLNKQGSVHYAALRCHSCNRHIQWLTPLSTQQLLDLGVDLIDNHNTTKLNDLDLS